MRTQAQERFIGQPEWNRCVGSATSIVLDSIAKQREESDNTIAYFFVAMTVVLMATMLGVVFMGGR